MQIWPRGMYHTFVNCFKCQSSYLLGPLTFDLVEHLGYGSWREIELHQHSAEQTGAAWNGVPCSRKHCVTWLRNWNCDLMIEPNTLTIVHRFFLRIIVHNPPCIVDVQYLLQWWTSGMYNGWTVFELSFRTCSLHNSFLNHIREITFFLSEHEY